MSTAAGEPGPAGDLTARLAQRHRSRLLRWLVAAGCVLVLLVLAGLAWFSPLLRVEAVEVTGGGITDPQAVAADAEAASLGVPLPQIRTGALGEELTAGHPTAAGITVSYSGPRSLAVSIEDRVPVIAVVSGAAAQRYDAHGELIDTVPAGEAGRAGLPELTVSGGADPSAAAVQAAALVAGLGSELPGEITELRAAGASGTLTAAVALEGTEAEVVFGTAEDAQRKARIAALILAEGAERVDVSVPDAPAAG
ncbi:hypothetical protein [Brevibacterium album]|uniref:hypothetical protein n=1 Tax=Brevibacterium album TaxID=417948 RepID=UPI000412C79B|nr:hypothetical protein [Brevibacterium album]